MQHAEHTLQDASSTPQITNDDDTYRLMVLRYDQTEDEVDRKYLQTALDLGINVPQSPRTTLDLVNHHASHIDINPSPPEPSLPSSSWASNSTNTASDGSIDQRGHLKTPSLAADSITSAPSTSSASSNKFNYTRIKRSLRRLSTVRRRKTLSAAAPDLSFPPLQSRLRRPSLGPRIATSETIASSSPLQPHALTTNASLMGTMRRHHVSTTYLPTVYYAQPEVCVLPQKHPPPGPSPTPEPEIHINDGSETLSIELDAAMARSLHHPALKKLRTVQLQEQLRFISFQASQNRLMRTAHLQAKRNALTSYKAREANLENTHADTLTSLEHRHLTAEMDLRKGLEAEKKACNTRLKHMQAYCNPRNNVEGMPRREVTKADYHQLEQQYHLHNTMDNLHANKINVLREKQARQYDRITAKQEAELINAEREFDRQNSHLDVQFQSEEVLLTEEFVARRKRLVRRWDLAETIERRKLEIETGDEYGPLPPIKWSKDANPCPLDLDADGIRQESSGKFSSSSMSDDGDNIDQDDEAEAAYNVTNLI